MKIKILLLLILLLSVTTVFAQKKVEIKGRFVDEEKKSIPFLSFTLQKAGESNIPSKHISNKEGIFKFKVPKGNYTLVSDTSFLLQ